MSKTDDTTDDKPKTVKRPAKPRAGKPGYHVPNGIAWLDGHGDEVRADGGTDVAADAIPADLIDEYADRGDIVKIEPATEEN